MDEVHAAFSKPAVDKAVKDLVADQDLEDVLVVVCAIAVGESCDFFEEAAFFIEPDGPGLDVCEF